MKIKKINENKIQITITADDLAEREVTKWELMPTSPKAQALFQDLLEYAYEEVGFEIDDDAQLMVEAYPVSLDSFIVVVTKYRPGYEDEIEVDLSKILDLIDDGYILTEFSNIDDVIDLCGRLKKVTGRSTLYKFDNEYYLFINTEEVQEIEPLVGMLTEYGSFVDWDESYLSERGTIILAEDAVEKLASMTQNN